jgi:hypothetical protein
MQGNLQVRKWWEGHFDRQCVALLHLIPAFTEPTMYHRADTDVLGPTLYIRQVDEIMVSAAEASDRKTVLDGIASHVIFKISPAILQQYACLGRSITGIVIMLDDRAIFAKTCIQCTA